MILASPLKCVLLIIFLAVIDCATICISTLSGISNYAKNSPFVGIVDKYLLSSGDGQGNDKENTAIGKEKLVYIPCASYAPTPSSTRSIGEQRRRARYEGKQKMLLVKDLLGLKKACLLEIDDSKVDEDVINNALNGASMVYIDGFVINLEALYHSSTNCLTHCSGNTFYLQYHLNRTGFWSIAKKYPKFLLIGSSAGGIVAGKSIVTSYYKGWDDPGVISNHIWDSSNLRGSSTLPYVLFMHYDKTIHHDLVMRKTIEYAVEGDITVCLPDNHALIYDGSDARVIDENGVGVTHECQNNIWFPR